MPLTVDLELEGRTLCSTSNFVPAFPVQSTYVV